MKTYLVFASDAYYPGGGMNDCRLVTTDLQEARAKAAELNFDSVEIWAVEDGKAEEVAAWYSGHEYPGSQVKP